MFRSRVSQRPMFSTRSRLAIVRDLAVLAVCFGIVLGFLLEVWRVRHPSTPVAPASVVAALIEAR